MRIIIMAVFLLVSSAVFSSAMTATSRVDTTNKPGNSQSTGLFGGMRPDGTFVFMLSENKGIRFYRVASGVRLIGFGSDQSLQNLPVKTPIRILTEQGRISLVEVLGGQP